MSHRFRAAAAIVLLVLFCLPAVPASHPEGDGLGRAAPDLTVVDGSWATDPKPPRLWDTIRINITVINKGDADAGSFSVAFYLNSTAKSIGTATVTSLSAGATANVSVNLATATTETYEYYQGVDYKIVIKVDSASRVTESDETNNDFNQTQALGPPRLPDLSLLGFSVSPASPVKGDLADINVSFTNTGEAAAKFFRVYAYLDDLMQTIGYVDITTVNLSEVRNVSLRWDTAGVPVGAHNILVHVNPEFLFTSIDEPNYSNNNGSHALVVTAPDFNLGLERLDIVPADLHIGDVLNVSWTVKNNGARPAENFTVSVALDGTEFFREYGSLSPAENRSGSAENETGLLAVGNHTLRLVAGNLDVERAIVLRPMRLADLATRNVGWDPVNPRLDQSVLVTLEVVNLGGLASNACDLGLYVDYSQSPVLKRDIPALAPDAYASFRFLWDTTGLSPGTHYMRLQADSGTVVAEINESNNNFRWDIVLTGEMDLSLENLSLLPRQPKSGDGVQFTLRVQNLGSLTSPATNLTLGINGFPVDRRAVGILGRGRSADITLAWATAGLPAGNYTYELALDSLPGDVAPDNNRIAEVLDLLPPPPAPDLRIARVDIEPRTPRVGENLSLGILVENAGNRDCGPSSVMVYFDSGLALLKFTDVPVSVPAIPVGTSARVNISRALSSFRPATYVLNITVDNKNEIAELNETNNRFTAELTLAEPEVKLPVLSVVNVTLEGQLRQGYSVNIVAVVSNQGEGDAQFVTVSFIIDGKVEWTVQIDQIKPGSEKTAAFLWKPSAGNHGLSVKAETLGANPAASPLRQETVLAPKGGTEGTDLTIPIVAGIVVAAAVAAVAGLLVMRRRRGPARQ